MTNQPSLLPMAVFSEAEEDAFGLLEDDAEIDAVMDALFPEALLNAL